MATLREESVWSSPVYLIERLYNMPMGGGEYGIANTQAKQLANRTRYLLNAILKEHASDGTHTLSEHNISENADIAESKLKLDVPTSDLHAELVEGQATLSEIISVLRSVQNLEGSKFKSIYEALMLAWSFGYPRFAFDMFTNNFTFGSGFESVKVLETIAGDDSIDVSDTSHIVPGESYIIWDDDTKTSTTVTVKKVLSNQRVVLEKDATKTRYNTGIFTKCPWACKYGSAEAQEGSSYITGKISILKDFDHGNLLIASRTPATFTVEYSKQTVWNPVANVSTKYIENIGLYVSLFETPGGILSFKITANNDTVIDHIAYMSDLTEAMNTTVRTPKIADSDFTLVRFGGIYGARHISTEFNLSPSTDFSDSNSVTVITFGANPSTNPIWDYELDVKGRYFFNPGDSVYWRARYFASDGNKSRWSDVGHYVEE